MSGRLGRSRRAASKRSLQWSHSQTDPNLPAGTHRKVGEREEERPGMQQNESLHQQGQGLVQLPRTWDSAWNLGLLGADGLHLSDKGKSIISHRLAKLVGRALKFLSEGTFSPSHSCQLNARPAGNAQSLERGHMSAGEPLKSSTKKNQPVQSFTGG